jgi:hypothetical protein
MGVFEACCSAETRPVNVPLQQPVPSAPATSRLSGAVERGMLLTAELQRLTRSELKARATVAGVPAVAVQGAESSSDPKNALIALLVAQDAVAANLPAAGVADHILASLDADGDGAWSAHELPSTPVTAACFSFLDKDGDGKVTKTELVAGATAIAGMAFMYFSKNGVPPQLHAWLSMIPGAASMLPAAAKS